MKNWLRKSQSFRQPLEQMTTKPIVSGHSRDFSRLIYSLDYNKKPNEIGEKSALEQQIQRIYDMKTFRDDALKCGRDYYGTDPSLEPERIIVAYALYQKARQGTDLGFAVIGRSPLREFDEKTGKSVTIPSDESYPSIDRVMGQNFGFMDEKLGGSGSILYAWKASLLGNDGWMLGGIQAKTEYHFASPLRWSNFWNDADNRMTIPAREIINLVTSGYEIWKPHLKLEPVAVCVDEKQAMNATLLTLKHDVQKYWEPNELEEFFQSLPKEVRE